MLAYPVPPKHTDDVLRRLPLRLDRQVVLVSDPSIRADLFMLAFMFFIARHAARTS
jgi:hypothetical protein